MNGPRGTTNSVPASECSTGMQNTILSSQSVTRSYQRDGPRDGILLDFPLCITLFHADTRMLGNMLTNTKFIDIDTIILDCREELLGISLPKSSP